MHRNPVLPNRKLRHPERRQRRGSTFVVVLALLALLAVVGLAFVTFTSAEKESAEYYLSANSRPAQEDFDALDFGIRQLVLGATADQYNSALWGGRHSLVAGMLGNDLNPHSGQGIHLGINTSTGEFFLDQDFDGIEDPNSGTILQINDSPVARNGFGPAATRLFQLPPPDIGCTYPDINNVFLAWRDYPLDSASGLPYLVMLPSFHRPGLLRDSNNSLPFSNWDVYPSEDTNGNGQLDSGEDTNNNGELDLGSSVEILRPHPSHVHILTDGISSNYHRFVRDASVATSLGLSGPFPFGNEDLNGNGTLDAGEDANHNQRLDAQGHHGVWTMTTGTPTRVGQWQRNNNSFARREANGSLVTQPYNPRYEFDADPDGDGIKEAIWLDLDHPVRVLADGRMVIPMFAFTVLDGDGLVNVNTAGNVSNVRTSRNPAGDIILDREASTPFGSTEDLNGNGTLESSEDSNSDGLLDTSFISRSSQGLLPSEVNPQWVLNASPIHDRSGSEAFRIHRQTFGYAPRDRAEASSMEWWFALKGARDVGVVYPGRAGEVAIASSGGIPQPGYSNFDDNGNRGEGQLINPTIGIPFNPGSLAGYRAFRHPLDFRASGKSVYFGTDLTSALDPGNVNNPSTWKWRPGMYSSNTRMERWNQYRGFQGGVNGQNYVHWNTLFNGSVTLLPFQDPLEDDEAETVIDGRFNQFSDASFTGSENFLFQASDADLPIAELESRLVALMPFNLKNNRRAIRIRHNLTTDSWDLKSFRRAQSVRRLWEFPNTAKHRLAANLLEDGILRDEVCHLLDHNGEQLQLWNPPAQVDATVWVQTFGFPISSPLLTHYETRAYRLSLNHLLTWSNENANSKQLVFRPLTPHPDPALLTVTFIPVARPAFPPQNATAQEYWARRDRQRMARDIYSLLYLFCNGDDGKNPSLDLNTSPRNIHDERRLQEMAQFAVNLVDAMDRDSINTVFEYDKDLSAGLGSASAGWDLDDNPFTPGVAPPTTAEPATMRGVVTGVEVQQLTISEAFTVFAPMILDAAGGTRIDHLLTEHDDRNPRGFGWFEIRNSGTEAVDLSTGAWKLQLMTSDGIGEDLNVNGVLDRGEDVNNNGVLDPGEDRNNNAALDPGEDTNGDGLLTLGTPHTAIIPRSFTTGQTTHTLLQPGDVLAIGTGTDTNHEMVQDPNNANAMIAGDPRPAYLRIDLAGSGMSFSHIAPGNRKPNTHYLDLIHPATTSTSHYTLERNDQVISPTIGGSPNPRFPGLLLKDLAGDDPSTNAPWVVPTLKDNPDPQAVLYGAALRLALTDKPLYLLLKRRMYPGRAAPATMTPQQEADNPWITVDRMLIPKQSDGPGTSLPNGWTRELVIADDATPTQIRRALALLRSRERSQPFGRLDTDEHFNVPQYAKQAFYGFGSPDEDSNYNGMLDMGEDLNNNGVLDPGIDLYGDQVPRHNTIGNTVFSTLANGTGNTPIENSTSYHRPGEDINRNGQLDPGEDSNGNGLLDGIHLHNVTTSQRHFDRDLASPIELLQIPLYGPEEATRLVKDHSLRPQHQYDKFTVSANTSPDGWFFPLPATDAIVAASRFLTPDHPSAALQQDNRWYRLLEFVEIPSRMERFASVSEDTNNNGLLDPGEDLNNNNVLDAYLPRNRRHRVGGRINLNTIREPDVLAALLDEPHAFHRNHNLGNPRYLVDRFEPNRDWWIQFRLSRDGIDPLTGFTLPGMPGSRPFRDLGFLSTGKTSLEHTLLRSLPLDANLPDDKRRLFGLGTRQQWMTNEDVNRNHMWDNSEDTNFNKQLDIPVELSVRQHINSKIFNNTTVRSHVFQVFLKVEWFEAFQMPHPQDPSKHVTRIGGKVTDVPAQRGFFVIDRSRAIEQATHGLALPPSPEDSNKNGILDPGEDQNGNGFLDRAYNFADAPQPINVDPLIIYKAVIE